MQVKFILVSTALFPAFVTCSTGNEDTVSVPRSQETQGDAI